MTNKLTWATVAFVVCSGLIIGTIAGYTPEEHPIRYTSIFKCIECDKHITQRDVCNNNGICPNCGYDSIGPTCKFTKEIGHWKYIGCTWYQLPQYKWIKKQ